MVEYKSFFLIDLPTKRLTMGIFDHELDLVLCHPFNSTDFTECVCDFILQYSSTHTTRLCGYIA